MKRKHFIIPVLLLLCMVMLMMHGPIAQDAGYHLFTDDRTIGGIPNFFNVVSNLPFAFIGLFGIRAVKDLAEKKLKTSAWVLFGGFVLLTIGSGYYHLWPSNATLVYDRLCMVIIFMSFFSFMLQTHIAELNRYGLLLHLNLIGVCSVVYWWISEEWGRGDLRPYALVQFFPLLALPLLLVLYPSPYKMGRHIWFIFLFFALAKGAESWDEQMYHALNHTLSGHSLKHLLMAVAGYFIVGLMHRRTAAVHKD